jgi:hypothetical protein
VARVSTRVPLSGPVLTVRQLRGWGTLAATILVHPRSLKDPAVAAAIDRAVADLRYGTVGVNVWALTAYGLASLPWGGYPGSPAHDIQSGVGWVRNTYLLEDVEKSVLRAPWRLGKKGSPVVPVGGERRRSK